MSLRAWSWISGIAALLTLLIPVGYTWFVVTRAPDEVWGWWHEFVSTFFSVGFTAAVAIWLYTWQTQRTAVDRKRELRAALLTIVFDIRDLVDDSNLKTVRLPDESEEKVLLTFLQPTIFEEAMRSGLFRAAETLILSRMAAIIQIYNGKVTRFMEDYSALQARGEDEHVKSDVVEQLRDQLYAIQDDVQQIVTGCENLMKKWSFKELTEALAIANADASDELDPKVEYLLSQSKLRVRPAGYKVGLYAKLWEIEDALGSGDRETPRALVDELVEEVHAMPKDRITTEEIESLIAQANEIKESLGDPHQSD